MSRWSRRNVLQSAAGAGAAAVVGDLAFLNHLAPVSAEDSRLTPGTVQLRPDMEPLVRLIEETSREQLLERVAAEIRRGAGYRQILGALMLAGVRGIQPRPVGFKFHAVLVVHSAHLASQASPDSDRWLPLFWALDQFKSSQADNKRQGDWHMPPPKEMPLPTAAQARARFQEAMDHWDEAAADQAVVGLARTAGAAEVFEIFARYGARDFRDIGHKAIYVANSYRTLQAIGWEHAEPVLRSLTLALLERGGTKGNPAELDEPADRPWRRNLERVKRIKPEVVWSGPTGDSAATAEVLMALRSGTPDEAGDRIVELLNRGVPVSVVWDGVLAGSGELISRHPDIQGIHCVTSANALHYAATTSGNDETRLMLLLQGAAFMTLFRQGMGLNADPAQGVDRMAAAEGIGSGPEAIEAILADVSGKKPEAARKTLAYLKAGGNPEALMTAARRLIFLKGNNAHDYKFSSAALEDYYHVSPAWRDRYLATSMFNLRGSGDRDNPLVQRTRAALQG
jgi:hypothetical protein